MKTKYYTKLLLPLCLFCALFRFLELAFAVEYSIDSYFYVSGSIIPLIFNIFLGLCVAFFFSFWAIDKVKSLTSTSSREKKAELKAIKAEGKEAYKAYINDNKKDIELKSEFARMKKLDGKTTFLYVIASILILAFSAQLLLDELGANAVAYGSIKDLFGTLVPYIFVAAVLSVLFFVQFAASPKATSKGKFWMVLAFAPALFYTLLVFFVFQAHSGIVSKVFVAFDFLKIAALAISLISIPQLFISSNHKAVFLSSSLTAVFLSTVRFTDGIVSMIMAMGQGYGILSHLDKIDVDPLLAAGDLFLSLALMLTAVRLCKKSKKKRAVKESTEDTVETSAEEPTEIPTEETQEPTNEVPENEAVSEDIIVEEESLESVSEEPAEEAISEPAENSAEDMEEEQEKAEEESEITEDK